MSTINFLIRIDWIKVTFIIRLLSSEFQNEILPMNKKSPWKRVCIHWQSPNGTVNQFSSVQSLSRVWFFATPWLQHARLSCPSPTPRAYTNSCPLYWWLPSNHLTLCHALLPPSIFPSIRVLSNESVLHIRWPKYWSFSFSISPSNEYSGLISFRMDRLDLLAVQGALKSLLQHHSSKASILQHLDYFIAQLSHPYMTTEKP